MEGKAIIDADGIPIYYKFNAAGANRALDENAGAIIPH
jgi:hypothetical protein